MTSVGARLLVTGAGTAAASNLIRALRAGDRSLVIVGCHSDRFVLAKSTADPNYLTPAPTDRGFLRALGRVIRRARVDLLIPTTDLLKVAVDYEAHWVLDFHPHSQERGRLDPYRRSLLSLGKLAEELSAS